MKLSKVFFAYSTLSLMALSVPLTVVACSTNDQIYENIKVFSTNDNHGRLVKTKKEAGLQAISGFLKEQQFDLLLDGGDFIQGTALNDIDKGKTTAKIAKLMNYDAIAVGNHEFDFGLPNLMQIIETENDNFLSANVRYKKDQKRVFTASKVKILTNGLKVGIIGLSSLKTPTTTKPANVQELDFTDLVTETRQEIVLLEKQGINFIVVVSHVGPGSTVPLAQALNNKIDLIVDGHTHQSFFQTVGTTQIVQTGDYTKFLRVSTFNFNATSGFIENFQTNLINYDQLAPFETKADPQISSLINDLKKVEEAEFNQVVINDNPYLLNGEAEILGNETNLGNLVTDAMFAAALKDSTKKDLAFAVTNSGGIRTSIQKGVVTKRDTYNVFPFGNSLVVLEASGKVVKEMLDYSVSKRNAGSFLQVSANLKMTQQADKTWVYEIKTGDQFVALDLNKKYKIVTQDFLQSGGDGYSMLTPLTSVASGDDIRLVLEDYLKQLDATTWAKYANPLPGERIIFASK